MFKSKGNRLLSKSLICIFAIALAGNIAKADSRIQQSTKDALNYFKASYELTYAPSEWKKKYANWEVNQQYSLALSKVEERSDLNVLGARRILMDFIYAMRDYHVSIRFHSTEESTLPLTIRSAEGRYFIVYIDTDKLDSKSYPFQVGDEVMSFNGKPVGETVEMLKATKEENVKETDLARAELALTARRRAGGLEPQNGPVSIEVKSQATGKTISRQLVWDYKPEEIAVPKQNRMQERGENSALKSLAAFDFNMSVDSTSAATDPHQLGMRNSYLPKLGQAIWESDDSDYFQAYIYRGENNKMIGVVRIRSYSFGDGADYEKAVSSFSKIVNRMEKFTDAMVIDQLNNPGGSVFYLYALASILSPDTLQTPRHIMSLTPSNVKSCVATLKQLSAIDSDEAARKALGNTVGGYPVTLQFTQFYKNYCQTYVEDWTSGRTMTRPFWIAGVDHLNPYPGGTYSKPILVLVNELDFSGGDFFPSILQDNKRATIFGARTAGAGGYVYDFAFPNLLGVDAFRITQSLAYRVSNNPIENLGVTPDVDYVMKASDRQSNYSEYAKAANKAVMDLIK